MAPPLLQLKDIALTFGGTPLLAGAELSVSPGERVSLVGRNGSGKSTLLKIAAGLVEPDRGSVFVQPGALVRYLPQEPDLSGFATTLAYVEAGLITDAESDHHRARSCHYRTPSGLLRLLQPILYGGNSQHQRQVTDRISGPPRRSAAARARRGAAASRVPRCAGER